MKQTSPVRSLRTYQEIFDHLVWLYRYKHFYAKYHSLFTPVKQQQLQQFLQDIAPDSSDYGLVIHVSPSDPDLAGPEGFSVNGERFSVDGERFSGGSEVFSVDRYDFTGPPRKSIGIFAPSISLFLRGSRLIQMPERYYIEQEDCYSSEDNALNQSYRSMIQLIHFLKQAASYTDQTTQTLHFAGSEPRALIIAYSAEQLSISYPDVTQLLLRLESPIHQSQKLELLVNEIFSVKLPENPEKRFIHFLHFLPEVIVRLDQNYRLFCAEFSFDKIREKELELKIEQLSKIHKVFGDIQNQILSIPLSILVITTSIKPASSDNSSQSAINLAVLIATGGYVMLMAFLLRNQWHTLTAISQELGRKKELLEKNYGQILDMVGQMFPELYNRVQAQKVAIYSVGCLLSLLMGGTLYYYFYCQNGAIPIH